MSLIQRGKKKKINLKNKPGCVNSLPAAEQQNRKVLNSEIYLYFVATGSREQIISRRSQSQHMQGFPQIKQIWLSQWAAREKRVWNRGEKYTTERIS